MTEEQKTEMCKRIMKAMGICCHQWIRKDRIDIEEGDMISQNQLICEICNAEYSNDFGYIVLYHIRSVIRYDLDNDAFDKLWKYIVEHVSYLEQRYQKIHDDDMPKYWCLMRIGGGVFAIGKSGEDMKLAVLKAFDKWLVEREGEVCKNDN